MLKAVALTFVAGVVLLVGGQTDEATLKKERARFKGTWKIVKFENAQGEKDDLKDATVVFDDVGVLEMRKGDETKKADYKINLTAKPPHIDVAHADDANKIMKGIYELKKDVLRICLCADPNGERPTELKVQAGSPHIMVTLERAK
jgi:uncharacterized protein (TIGR03067 family)